jgi:hypothetical protein
VVRIRYLRVKGRAPLGVRQMRDFRKLVERFKEEIVQKWVDIFVLHKRIEPRTISRRLP